MLTGDSAVLLSKVANEYLILDLLVPRTRKIKGFFLPYSETQKQRLTGKLENIIVGLTCSNCLLFYYHRTY